MAAKRTLITGVCAAVLAGCALTCAAPAASAASVELKITESWSGSLPQRVEPGQTVTLLTSFGQNTYHQPIQISGLSFGLSAQGSTIDHEVQVQFMNPVTHAWVTESPDNGQSWSYEFDTFLTEEPGKTYTSGVRFTIEDKAPAGTWTVDYPTVWGVTTQTALPYGAISFPTGPTRTFTFKSSTATAPVPVHSTAPASVRTTHAASKPSPSPSPRKAATSAAPTTPSATETATTAAAPSPSAAAPSATPISADLAADGKPSSTASPALAAGAAAAVVALLLGLGLWRRVRRRGV
ncbi:hypothetical protein KDL01_01250 [Actinospica durhamensis]|uniref:LPXTG cell wall anchor domain-containing protein n=1 Tax=Actinospica durhamensis TaxID=1508375 RepID=A0A941EJF0_9ACTN|nr:hypothetical protein [Actinospica durhamensis]MBR7831865.1 hypothetical protein [Actinospica durhamensis]